MVFSAIATERSAAFLASRVIVFEPQMVSADKAVIPLL